MEKINEQEGSATLIAIRNELSLMTKYGRCAALLSRVA